MSCCSDNHSSLFKLLLLLRQMKSTLQLEVAPHVAVVRQPTWKQEGCIKRERSQWDSREGQSGEGAAQVLTSSAVQRLVVFVNLVTARRHSPAHLTVQHLLCWCASTIPQPCWKSTEACVPTDAVSHCFRLQILFCFVLFF